MVIIDIHLRHDHRWSTFSLQTTRPVLIGTANSHKLRLTFLVIFSEANCVYVSDDIDRMVLAQVHTKSLVPWLNTSRLRNKPEPFLSDEIVGIRCVKIIVKK